MQLNTFTIPKPEHGSQEWLSVRWRNEQGLARIAASEAAAVHNDHGFMSSGDLALSKLADAPPQPIEQNKAMERGQRLEPFVLSWYKDMNGGDVATPEVMYCYEEEGVRLIATLDAVKRVDGGFTPVEIKTINRRWTGDMPRYWYWQGVQQAICTGSDQVEWVIFDNNLELHTYTQVVTSDERQVHIEACRAFLKAIDAGEMPEGATFSYDDISQRHPEGDGRTVELGQDWAETLEALAGVNAEIKQLKEAEDALKATLCQQLGDAEFGTIDGTLVVSWKTAKRTAFDQKRFEAEHPALAEKFKKTTTYRTFRVLSEGGK